jgi:hypothetical protein
MDTLQFPATATKTASIPIAEQDLVQFKQAGDRLCVAKQVDGTYSVIWRSSSQYPASNQFQWMAQSF